MKRLLVILSIALSLPITVHASGCMKDPIHEKNWNAEVTTGMRVRDIPCMEGSAVLTTVPVGQVVHIIAETDGWYKVELKDGTIGWSGQWLVAKTNKSFQTEKPDEPEAPKEPLFDVEGHNYETAIRYLNDNKIVEGYPDGSYQPDKTVNRAEFTKIIIGAALNYDPNQDPSGYDIYAPVGLSFSDIKSGEWYIPYLRKAVENDVISGYPDGTFKPSQTINLAEASKILVNALNVSKSDETDNIWYRPYINALQNKGYVPNSFNSLDNNVTRGQMAEMVWRILEKVNDRPFKQFDMSDPEPSAQLSCSDSHLPSSIDMAEVREAWLGWVNTERAKLGLHPYVYNDQLNASANEWSKYSANKGVMSHKRPGQTEYYDYGMITQWFKDLGLEFKNVNTVTYSENIGRGPFSCNQSDCTQELIDAIKSTFDFYMAEKNDSYKPHYESVMNSYFNEIGLGIALSGSQYYLTVHYGTELIAHPTQTCNQ